MVSQFSVLVLAVAFTTKQSCKLQHEEVSFDCVPATFGWSDDTNLEETLVITMGISHPDSQDSHCCTDACRITRGNIVLLERGKCGFYDKAKNAQRAGASAVIIINDRASEPFPMGAPVASPMKILVAMVSHNIGRSLSSIAEQSDNPKITLRASQKNEIISVAYLPHVHAEETSTFQLNPSIRVTSQVLELKKAFYIYVHDPQNCRFISKNLVETGRWEDLISKRIIAIMKTAADGLFVDVGANVGWFTLLAAAMGHDVIAIEPMRYNMELLEASIAESGVAEQIVVHKTAVGEAPAPEGGDNTMCVLPAFGGDPTANTGNGQLHPLTAENANLCTDLVKVSTLDVLIGDVSRKIHAIKLDIEGFETLALR